MVYDKTRIARWDSGVGKAIPVNGGDVSNVARAIDPAALSPQVSQFIELAISLTKEFMGATDAALGDTRPDNTCAIIALQKASSVPMELTKQNFTAQTEPETAQNDTAASIPESPRTEEDAGRPAKWTLEDLAGDLSAYAYIMTTEDGREVTYPQFRKAYKAAHPDAKSAEIRSAFLDGGDVFEETMRQSGAERGGFGENTVGAVENPYGYQQRQSRLEPETAQNDTAASTGEAAAHIYYLL